jgi:hypothetical protein
MLLAFSRCVAASSQAPSIFGLSMSAFERKADIADLRVDGSF